MCRFETAEKFVCNQTLGDDFDWANSYVVLRQNPYFASAGIDDCVHLVNRIQAIALCASGTIRPTTDDEKAMMRRHELRHIKIMALLDEGALQ